MSLHDDINQTLRSELDALDGAIGIRHASDLSSRKTVKPRDRPALPR